jgi:hypothetical protein
MRVGVRCVHEHARMRACLCLTWRHHLSCVSRLGPGGVAWACTTLPA